jgi:hypothetical protein
MNTPPRLIHRRFILAFALLNALWLPTIMAASAAPPAAIAKVREPAVAGLFYPKDPAELSRVVDACLAGAGTMPFDGELKALICPHAGYAFSGPVAGSAYRLLIGRQYDTVVVMGPSHYADLRGASVTDATVFRTPLGDVPISAKSPLLARSSPFALEARCDVQRPDWWPQSSRAAPAVDTADTWEHSVEVEIPFLQKTLKSFQLVSVVMGQVDPAQAASALGKFIDDRTLIVASSDLSHYYSYAIARELDEHCVKAICDLDIEAMETQEACGRIPILTLMHLARERGWKACLIDQRNSGDTAGDKSRVVGYAAIAFYAPAPETFTVADRKYLLELARKTVRAVASGGPLPEVSGASLATKFTAPQGCFVTLTEHGDLRGCIGYIRAQGPLYKAVIENARNAAISDPRFPPVAPDEVDRLQIEISVLTEPQPLPFTSSADLLQKLQPHKDGVVLQIGARGATYLPQVWDQLPDKVEFLNSLAEKAGCDRTDWRQPGTSVFIYHVEAFKESDVLPAAKTK